MPLRWSMKNRRSTILENVCFLCFDFDQISPDQIRTSEFTRNGECWDQII